MTEQPLPSIRKVLVRNGCITAALALVLVNIVVVLFFGMVFLFGFLFLSFASALHPDAVLQSASNGSDPSVVAYVISDSCGTTCECTIRVDVETSTQKYIEVWRGIDVCNAQITWITDTTFIITETANIEMIERAHTIDVDVLSAK
jgi:hypothetical protein